MLYYSKIFKACFSAFICLIFAFSSETALAYELNPDNAWIVDSMTYDENGVLLFQWHVGENVTGNNQCLGLEATGQLHEYSVYNDQGFFRNPINIFGTCRSPSNGVYCASNIPCTVAFQQFGIYQAPTINYANNSYGVTKSDIDGLAGSDFLENLPFHVGYLLSYGGSNLLDWFLQPTSAFPIGYSPYVSNILNPPTIYPSFPPDGINTTTSDMTSWNATGSISIDALDTNTWYNISIELLPVEIFGENIAIYYMGFFDIYGIQPGQNATYTINASDIKNYFGESISSGIFKVSYSFNGVNSEGARISYSHSIENTIIRDIDMPTISTTTPSQFEIVILEDCSLLGIPDKWFCEIKNAILGTFAPTSAKISELQNTLSQINNRFPINYLTVAKNRWQYIADNISTTSNPINISILGSPTSSMDFDVLNEIGLKSVIQSFFGLIFIVIEIVWFISFMNRIF